MAIDKGNPTTPGKKNIAMNYPPKTSERSAFLENTLCFDVWLILLTRAFCQCFIVFVVLWSYGFVFGLCFFRMYVITIKYNKYINDKETF